MISFWNRSVRVRMLACLAVLVCVTCGLGLFAINRLTRVNGAAAEIRLHSLPVTGALGETGTTITRYRQLEAAAIMTDGDERQTETNLLRRVRDDAEKAVTALGALALEGKDRELADQIKREWAAYLGQSDRFLAAMAAGKTHEADDLYRGPMRDIYRRLYGALLDDIHYNLAQGIEAAQRGAELGSDARLWIIGGMIVAILLGLLVSYVLFRMIAQPVVAITKVMAALANGDTDVAVPARDRKDEIGAMAGSIQVFKDAAIAKRQLEHEAESARRTSDEERHRVELVREQLSKEQSDVVAAIGAGLEALSHGNLSASLEQPFPADYEALRANYNRAIAELRQLVSGIVVNTGTIRSGTGEIAQAADDLSRRTEQQAASLEETAAALEQITATVRRTAEGAKQAGDVVSKARTDAARSGAVVQDTVAAMSEIEQSARQISQIIGVIDEIAFQTNLLALNAGVEAARAGDAGRGFAVVAQEVRALAQRSADAAKEIKALISTSTQQVGRGVDLVGETGRSLGRIIEQVSEIDTVVTEIAHAATEQATGLAEVNTAVSEMDRVTQQNAAMVEQSTAAARLLAQETEELATMTARFDLGTVTSVQTAKPGAGVGRGPIALHADSGAHSVERLLQPGRLMPKRSRPDTVVTMRPGGRGNVAHRLKAEEEGWEEF